MDDLVKLFEDLETLVKLKGRLHRLPDSDVKSELGELLPLLMSKHGALYKRAAALKAGTSAPNPVATRFQPRSTV